MKLNKIYQGDCLEVLKTLPDESIDCAITSPPYWALRDYGVSGQLGLEKTFTEYVNKLCDIFDEVKRVLKKDGTCWVNIGDTYSGIKVGNTEKYKNKKVETSSFIKQRQTIKDKSLCQIPSRFAIEMSDRGWILRNEIIWHKPNCMPQSVTDRFTVDYEKMFFFSKNKKYYFNQQKEKAKWADDPRAVFGRLHYRGKRECQKGTRQERNLRSVWTIPTKPFKEAHFATYPEKLIEIPIKSCCPENGIVLDMFMGGGTTGLVAKKLKRNYIGIELNSKYIEIAEKRINSILF